MITPSVLIPGTNMPHAGVPVILFKADFKTQIQRFLLVNTTGGMIQAFLYRVTGSGAAAVTDQTWPGKQVTVPGPSNGTAIVSEMEGLTLEVGDTIQGYASATGLNIQVSGVLVT